MVLLGIGLTILMETLIRHVKKSSPVIPLIKRYWTFIILFFFFSIALYFFIYKYSPSKNLESNLNVAGQSLTLIFAIVVGYFAFQQVIENKFEKLKEQANSSFRRNRYIRAIKYYEEARLINPKDFYLLAELVEVYLIIQNPTKFNENIIRLEKLIIEECEWSVVYYLKIANHLLKQDLGSAKIELKNYLQKAIENKSILTNFSWGFSEIKKSNPYKKIDGDVKTIFDNFLNYLSKSFSESDLKNFEEGNYELSKANT